MPHEDRYLLAPENTDPKRMAREREKARKLKKSAWWHQKIQAGLCHYCGGRFPARDLTLDHIVPIARGGASTHGNVVPACRDCNRDKKLLTPAEKILREGLK